jgi:AraC-like DNA-binding protein
VKRHIAVTPEMLSDTPPAPGARADVLSDLLRVVRLSGASLFHAEFREPWAVLTGGGAALARAMNLASRRVVPFHVVMQGRCSISLDGRRIELAQGDVVILAHGDAHVLGAGEATPLPLGRILPPPPWHPGLVRLAHGGEGPAMQLFCGFLHCDALGFRPLLAGLPRLMVLRPFADGSSPWLRSTVELIVREVEARRPGSQLMLERLNEMVFVEALREFIAGAEAPDTGWLAGVKDRYVGRVLELIHAEPARSWSVPELSQHSGLSRSALADRFRRLVGQSPIDYLKAWRLQLACGLLRQGEAKVRDVAQAVGYESEASFSKAFRRAFGVPPGAWRRGSDAASPGA